MKKILLVEDDDTQAKVIEGVLISAGFSVVIETEGDRAFETTHQVVPDLIILDILLRGANGWDFLAQTKGHAGCFCAKMPVLILTNVTTGGDDYAKATEMGAVDYLVKANLTPGEIVAKVKKTLGKMI